MAEWFHLPSFEDERGALTVLEKRLPFDIKRVYWIHSLQAGQTRGAHRHLVTRQAMVCLSGACKVQIKNQSGEQLYHLTDTEHVLLLEPEDWHEMSGFNSDTILMLLASHEYDPKDYVKEPLQCKSAMKT